MSELALKASEVYKDIKSVEEHIHILKGVNLSLAKGESVAIVGESGSGKSTLLGLLAGLDIPQKGSIKVNGNEITDLNEGQRAEVRAKEAGFVFQSFYLLEDLTAEENVALPLELFGHPKPSIVAKKWLEKIGLKGRLNHYPKQLSGGEQQRVALCRAFVVKPAILFADEPTANLDNHTAQKVIELLFELHKTSASSMILVTHDNELAKRCDRIFRLKGGQLNAVSAT